MQERDGRRSRAGGRSLLVPSRVCCSVLDALATLGIPVVARLPPILITLIVAAILLLALSFAAIGIGLANTGSLGVLLETVRPARIVTAMVAGGHRRASSD